MMIMIRMMMMMMMLLTTFLVMMMMMMMMIMMVMVMMMILMMPGAGYISLWLAKKQGNQILHFISPPSPCKKYDQDMIMPSSKTVLSFK